MPRVQSSGSDKKSATPIRPVETPERARRVSGRARSSDADDRAFTHDEIAERAYELFLARGSEDGHDLEDWLEAERLVKSQSAGQKVSDTIQ